MQRERIDRGLLRGEGRVLPVHGDGFLKILGLDRVVVPYLCEYNNSRGTDLTGALGTVLPQGTVRVLPPTWFFVVDALYGSHSYS